MKIFVIDKFNKPKKVEKDKVKFNPSMWPLNLRDIRNELLKAQQKLAIQTNDLAKTEWEHTHSFETGSKDILKNTLFLLFANYGWPSTNFKIQRYFRK